MIKFDDPNTWPARWIDRCQIISEEMEFRHRETGEVIRRSASEVFNYDPHGELFKIHDWFIQSAIAREVKARLAAGEDQETIRRDIEARRNSAALQE